MQLADNLNPLTLSLSPSRSYIPTYTATHLWKWHWHTDRPSTEDEVTLKPSDQDSHWGALGFFPGTRSRGISLAKCLRGVVALLKDGN